MKSGDDLGICCSDLLYLYVFRRGESHSVGGGGGNAPPTFTEVKWLYGLNDILVTKNVEVFRILFKSVRRKDIATKFFV